MNMYLWQNGEEINPPVRIFFFFLGGGWKSCWHGFKGQRGREKKNKMNKPKQHTSRGPTTAIWKTLTLCRAAGGCRWMILCEQKKGSWGKKKRNAKKKYLFLEDKNRKLVIVHYNCAARRLGDPYRSAASPLPVFLYQRSSDVYR